MLRNYNLFAQMNLRNSDSKSSSDVCIGLLTTVENIIQSGLREDQLDSLPPS